MLEHWIWLAHRSAVSDRLKIELLQHFGTPEHVYFASEEELVQFGKLKSEALESLLDRNLTASRKIQDSCSAGNIRTLTFFDEAYPERLKNIYDPPILLYYKGTLPDFDSLPGIAVVGTRKASAYGTGAARRLGFEISSCGGLVVSGLADGIDAAAMNGALLTGKPTVGVLGCGVDVIYPRSNKTLFADVMRYGCILSEFAPGTEPFRWHFPKRNRIISGLSCGVVVVEAPKKSGSLITAKNALEQGRDVFAVPGNIDLPNFDGSNALLRDGAGAVSCGWDIMEEYRARFPDVVHRAEKTLPSKPDSPSDTEQSQTEEPLPKVAQKPRVPGKKTKKSESAVQKSIDKQPAAPYSDLSEKLQSLTELQKTIVEPLKRGEQYVDDVIAETGVPAGKMLAELTILELKKIIVRRPGKRIALRTGKD